MSRGPGRGRVELGAFPALERSSEVMRRTVELYRAIYPVPSARLDEATWSECARRARVEVEGRRP